MAERHRDTQVLRRQLDRLLDERPRRRRAVDAALADLNADVDALDALLEQQNYRIAYWRTAGRELGYRRFFDINTLIGLRVEDPEVFADTHELILRWVADGVVDGLRVDHPDGLARPRAVRRPAGAGRRAACGRSSRRSSSVGRGAARRRGPSPAPPATTGSASIGGLFVDPAGEARDHRGLRPAHRGRHRRGGRRARRVASWRCNELLAADVTRLTALLVDVCEHRRHQRDRTRHELHEAVRALLVAFPVYRTYVRAGGGRGAARGRGDGGAAGGRVSPRSGPTSTPTCWRSCPTSCCCGCPTAPPLEDEWVMRFQQLTGPAMAKGVEDTAFYRSTRLLALNEVGGDLARFGVSVDAVHDANAAAHERWPDHDDHAVDPRHQAVGRRAGPAGAAVRDPRRVGATRAGGGSRRRPRTGQAARPDRHTQHLLFQTLVGAWPLTAERAAAYLEKATREAKVRTSWTEPDAAFDEARDAFVAGRVRATSACWPTSPASSRRSSGPGGSPRWRRRCCSSRRPACPTPTRAASCGTSAWSTPTTGAPSTSGCGARCSAGRGLGVARRSARRAGRPRRPRPAEAAGGAARRCTCGGGCPAVFGAGEPGRTPRWRSPAGRRPRCGFARGAVGPDDRGPAVAVVVPRLVLGLAAVGGWADTTVALPSGRWTDLLAGAAGTCPPIGGGVGAGRPVRSPTCSPPSRSPCWSAPRDPRQWVPPTGGRGNGFRIRSPFASGIRGSEPIASAPGAPGREDGGDRVGVGASGRAVGRGRAAAGGGWRWPRRTRWAAGRARSPAPARRRLRPLDRRRARRGPIPGRRTSRTASTGRPGWSTTAPSAGPTRGWAGFDLPSAVLYELHVGTFSPEGTFDGAIAHLDHLVALGVDAVELLPVVEFPGRRGWGYDGVDLWAPHHADGGPDGLKRLVDACHARGLGVVLDVVYNHLGPAGNHLAEFGPYFADRHPTNWGAGLNVDGPGSDEVRAFVVDNARMWLRDYHADGLRLDAVHAIADESATHVLELLAASVGAARAPSSAARCGCCPSPTSTRPGSSSRPTGAATGSTPPGPTSGTTPCTRCSRARRTATTATSARWPRWPRRCGRPGCTTACTRRTATGSTGDRRPACTAGSSWSAPRTTTRSATARGATGWAPRVAAAGCASPRPCCSRRRSCRCCSRARSGRRRPRSCTSPTTRTPTSGRAVSEGRRREFSYFGWAPEDVPDPQDPATYAASVLRWDEVGEGRARRRARLVPGADRPARGRPGLAAGPLDDVDGAFDEHARWLVVHRRPPACPWR